MQRNKSNKQGDCKNKQRGRGAAKPVKEGYFAKRYSSFMANMGGKPLSSGDAHDSWQRRLDK